MKSEKVVSLSLSLVCWLNILALEWYAILTNNTGPHFYVAIIVSFVMGLYAAASAMDKKK